MQNRCRSGQAPRSKQAYLSVVGRQAMQAVSCRMGTCCKVLAVGSAALPEAPRLTQRLVVTTMCNPVWPICNPVWAALNGIVPIL